MQHETIAPPHHTTAPCTHYPRSQGCVEHGIFAKSSRVPLGIEAHELERCAQLNVRTEHVLPVQLVSFDREANTLETRFVAGGSLFNLLWNTTGCLGAWRRSSRLFPCVASRIAEVGQWLRLYHGTTRQAADPGPAIDWIVASYRRKLEVTRQRALLQPDLLAAFEKHGEALEGALKAAARFELATIHGDFTCYNMLVSPDGLLHVVDFADARVGLPLEDVARLWHQLAMLAATSGRRQRLLGEAAAALLRGYGLDEAVCEARDFQALRLYNVLTHLNSTSAAWDYLGRGGRRAARRIDAVALDWARQTLRRLDLF